MAIRFSRLTRPAIRNLRAGQKITENGITAERLPEGDTRYSVNIMVDGQRIHRVVGRESHGVTRTQAEQFITRVSTEARAGRLSLPKGRKTALTVRRAAEDYLSRLEETNGKNLAAKRRQLRMYLIPFFSAQHLDALTSFTVDRYKRHRLDAGAANGTVNRELATLSHLLSKAVEWKWLAASPVRPKLLDEPRGRIIALSDKQCEKLLEAALADKDPDCWLFVLFGLNTAMRHQEILRARFDQIDFDKLRLFIPDAKAGQREQPITRDLAAILHEERNTRRAARDAQQRDTQREILHDRPDPDGWIFPTPRLAQSNTGHRDRMDKPFRRAVVAADLAAEQVTPHVMRHTAITNLVKANIDLPTIQRISGHKTLAMVLRYTHIHGSHIDHAIDKIGRGLPVKSGQQLSGAITQKLHAGEAALPVVNRAAG